MGKGRVRHIYARPAVLRGQRGVALINALALSIMIGLLIAGLYTGISILFKSTEEMRTFTSVREAAAAGARYAASMADYILQDRTCLQQPLRLEFEIAGRNGRGITEITLCRILSPQDLYGQEISGTSRDPVTIAALAKRGVFKIVSEARFGDQVSRVEAVYVRE